MSATSQAKAARRKARQDVRYVGLKTRTRVFRGHVKISGKKKG